MGESPGLLPGQIDYTSSYSDRYGKPKIRRSFRARASLLDSFDDKREEAIDLAAQCWRDDKLKPGAFDYVCVNVVG